MLPLLPLKISLPDRTIDIEGNVFYSINALIEILYKGISLSDLKELHLLEGEDISNYNKNAYKNFEKELKETDFIKLEERIENWFYPSEYDTINLYDRLIYLNEVYCLNNNLLDKDVRIERIEKELLEYEKRDLKKFLNCCVWLSDIIKNNDFIVGVGRGSSCASYILFLFEIHLVDSVIYDLDIKEFLK